MPYEADRRAGVARRAFETARRRRPSAARSKHVRRRPLEHTCTRALLTGAVDRRACPSRTCLRHGCRRATTRIRWPILHPEWRSTLATERGAHDPRTSATTWRSTFRPSAAEPIAGRATIRFVSTGRRSSTRARLRARRRRAEVGRRRRQAVALSRRQQSHRPSRRGDCRPARTSSRSSFRAGDAALNRNPDFLYTIFVPARAHLTFPCFDQPDLKARYTLELTVPADWQAVANGAEPSARP